MTFGIEGLKANYLFARGGDCWSYAYCEGRQEGKHRAIFERLDKLTLPRPDSFEAFGPSRDYYYTKQFSPLRSEDLSEDRLRRLFAGSLRTLVRWYEENSKA